MNELRLLANLPIFVGNIPIYSPTLKEVTSIGLEQYQILLTYCTITKCKLNDSLKIEASDNYDALIKLIQLDRNLLNTILVAFYFFTKMEFSLVLKDNYLIFSNGEIILDRNNYDTFVKLINLANNIENQEVEELDEFDRRVMEMEKKIQEAQNKDVKQPTFKDLVSAVANFDGNGLNIVNIWDLNIYQFHEQLQRGSLKDRYKFDLQQILAGANPDSVQVESYLKPI